MLRCLPSVTVSSSLEDGSYDSLVLVSPETSHDNAKVSSALSALQNVDKAALDCVSVVPVSLPCKRLIFSPTGPLNRDYDDVRRFSDAATAGVKRALSAGSTNPLVMVKGNIPGAGAEEAQLAGLLGALAALYVPLEIRDLGQEKSSKVTGLGWLGTKAVLDEALAIERGRIVCRDIGGSDPERTAAPRVEEYIREYFAGSSVKVEVVQGQKTFEAEYPCLAAVNRCSSTVARHDGRVIWLTYEPKDGKVEKSLFLVGKGITYDTGGADIKAGGVMAGMSRDKCGAAAAAGVMATISQLAPAGVRVVVAMAMVRNSVGSNCYVADEIITSRAGVRLRVGNTDAEGRMAMVDVLCHAKEKALKSPDPQIMTIATLTGHAVLSVGNYSAIMDNGPAKAAGTALKVQAAGEKIGDMFEISTVRREDWDFIKDKSGEFVSVLQCNNAPSSRTPRGHQFPAAFMMRVAGLDNHMLSSSQPLKYSHLDVAGSSGDLPHPTTGAAVPALVKWFLG